jgi:hypothetical protein
MGTNFYRIPSAKDMEDRRNRLQSTIRKMEMTPANIERAFGIIEDPDDQYTKLSPWDQFLEGSSVHLGKRSGGWKFCWNFHNGRYYNTKDELFKFIEEGRVVDEYGSEISSEEFIEMALNWCPDGWDNQTYYKENPMQRTSWFDPDRYNDIYIDELRVSSSTDFC